MKKKRICLLLVLIMVMTMFAGCGTDSTAKEDEDTITVYLWTTAMYEKYAPYIQSQLPDINIQFVVGNNDLDFYKFMNENGELPDIITCCRFSLHDAAPLKDNLMDLSTTSEAGAIYDSYLTSFTNEDGSVNWLPMCADVHGFITNKTLFDKYNIPLPADYESFVSACQAFEKVGIRGYVGDYAYDYTCMEALQGLSIPELTSEAGRKWRTAYSDPASTERVGLDDTVWPVVFEQMEQFIKDVNLTPDVLELDYEPVIKMFTNGEAAMISGSSARVMEFRDQGIDTVILPYFDQDGGQWLMTTPYLQVALNRDLEKDEARREKAMKVLDVMISEEGQTLLPTGQDVLSYSQDVGIHLTDSLENLKPLIEQNHMYIRIASNDFFAMSKDVVSKMITGEYNAQQACEAFDAGLQKPEEDSAEIVLTSEKSYSNIFHSDGGNEAFSVMANSLREVYESDVLIATGNSFTGSVFQADYTEKLAGSMVMPNGLSSYQCDMTGAELKGIVKAYVEGVEGGFRPFNRGSLPVVSGITIEVEENEGTYTLAKVKKDGKEIKDEETFSVTCLATSLHFAPFLEDESCAFIEGEANVKDTWTNAVKAGGVVLAQPESYLTLK
ncbi:extracellular solute-binding protein [Faecalicatena contorta]|uniref:ABC transporter substrate-binding protein n=1 Tax=Faecalicatena contorta TaxID=39482 RepID=UPI001F3D651A|nr:ABC transporter substrate-binding protein [Faecalicatena contorta]MCF2679365.1 extracellular solute-binding protein [Faecalicatena contorta]